MARTPSNTPVVSTPDPQIIATNTDLDTEFFIEENKGKITAFVLVALIALAAWLFYNHHQESKKQAAANTFTSAKTQEELQAVIAKYPDSVVSGNAQLLLAEKLRDAGKIDEALAVLEKFTKSQTAHPLLAQGWLSYAGTLELKGNFDKAAQTYANIAGQFGNSEAAPLALMAQARLVKKSGELVKAREIYENIVQRFPASYSAQQAQQEIGKLPEK